MPVLRVLPLALVLTKTSRPHSKPSHSPLKMVDTFAPISMAKATAPLCSLTAADSTRRAGGIRPGPWRPPDSDVLAIDFRGFGCSSGPGQADFDNAPFENDVLAAVRYLKAHGVKTVSVVGGSFGGGAAGDASIKSAQGEIDRIVFLGAAPNLPAEKLKSRALFIVARDDGNDAGPRLPGIRAQYEKAPQPKELIVLDGSAHAQFLFQTDQSDRVMREILRFLSIRHGLAGGDAFRGFTWLVAWWIAAQSRRRRPHARLGQSAGRIPLHSFRGGGAGVILPARGFPPGNGSPSPQSCFHPFSPSMFLLFTTHPGGPSSSHRAEAAQCGAWFWFWLSPRGRRSSKVDWRPRSPHRKQPKPGTSGKCGRGGASAPRTSKSSKP
jgi:alpha/beta superfamily hydrolase